MKTRTALLAAALPLAVLTACGSAGAQSAGTAAGARTVPTAFGAVAVPDAPARVVALGDTALDTALAVGVTPVGTLSSRGGTTVSAYLAGRAGDVALVGTVAETNVEAVVKAEPDLILAAAGTGRAQYDALSAIAPTVVPRVTAFGAWESDSRTFGAALGREQETQALLTRLQERAAAIRARVPEGATAAVVRWMPTGPLVMSGALMASRLLEQTGHELVPAARFADKPHTDPLSLENLGQIDADVLFVATLNEEGSKALAQAQGQPAFARLPAVRAGDVTAVDGGVWSSAAGPLAAANVLDDIERVRATG
ncbi:MAG: Periplasmic binding protein [Frankiales bacterium]|jgi:iron complex transport system substrate-binding protein|nr:Periplasmic binding protein [Frankiales bacterium]